MTLWQMYANMLTLKMLIRPGDVGERGADLLFLHYGLEESR